jgi:cytochrome c553
MAAEAGHAGAARRLRHLPFLAGLVFVPPAWAQQAIEEQAQTCLACHGEEAEQPETPLLHGQPALFLMTQLVQFRQGQRGDATPMAGIAAALGDKDIRALARYFAAQPPPPPAAARGEPDPERQSRGAALAAQHRCGSCHLPSFAGREQMPRLTGQKEAYLLKALRDYRAGTRIGSGAAMPEVMARVSDAEAQDLAYYLAWLEP